MKIYQIRTPKQYLESTFLRERSIITEDIMRMYAKDIACKFAAECVNEALGNKMEVSNALHYKIENMYNSIEWDIDKE